VSSAPRYGQGDVITAPTTTSAYGTSENYPIYPSTDTSRSPYEEVHPQYTMTTDTTSFASPNVPQVSGGYETRETKYSDVPARNEIGGSMTAGNERINTAASDNRLVALHQSLERFEAFDLDRLTSSAEPLTLQDTSHLGREVDYDPDTHTIRAPLNRRDGSARPLADVRSDILWEKHNASKRDVLRDLATMDPDVPSRNASPRAWDEYRFNKASYALAHEWLEWSMAMEFSTRARRINNEMAKEVGSQGGNHVTERIGSTKAEHWREFHNYLGKQVESNHTTSYDPDAAKSDWIGKRILARAQANSSKQDSLRISTKEIDDWKAGKSLNIKDYRSNPFLKF
jgi:hypothetical protein